MRKRRWRKWTRITLLITLVSFAITDFAFADRGVQAMVATTDVAPCDLVTLPYAALLPLELLEGDCLSAVIGLTERELDAGLISSPDSAIEALLARFGEHGLSPVEGPADLTDQVERELDAGLIG